MRHLIVYAHPNPDSLNRHLLDTVTSLLVQQGHEVVVRDLNQQNFNPVLSLEDIAGLYRGVVGADIQAEQNHVAWAGCITFIYPIWWTGMPAIMKGYIDRVFSYGFAYRYDEGIQKGLLQDKEAVIINTQGKSHAAYAASGMDKALVLTSDQGIFAYCGFRIREHFFFENADRAGAEQVQQWTGDIAQHYAIHHLQTN
ncbi:NAD(P)H-dependent oxidoreductase [Taibaiella chishuiensis]|uniref:NAD(P)H dehydrogenase (Quinone) n=1 Tax=Taibaiella chishuiensis TaxID=1434707 RepID=A0A2P8D1L2_9BACT|nr:NAD(P)H-dependent oxidoreductase [Taibaiella chishuiensis]PSK91114.1 NAD(P)H dehydrogenase (quinone) [Taibaiella chishuiensis]